MGIYNIKKKKRLQCKKYHKYYEKIKQFIRRIIKLIIRSLLQNSHCTCTKTFSLLSQNILLLFRSDKVVPTSSALNICILRVC